MVSDWGGRGSLAPLGRRDRRHTVEMATGYETESEPEQEPDPELETILDPSSWFSSSPIPNLEAAHG